MDANKKSGQQDAEEPEVQMNDNVSKFLADLEKRKAEQDLEGPEGMGASFSSSSGLTGEQMVQQLVNQGAVKERVNQTIKEDSMTMAIETSQKNHNFLGEMDDFLKDLDSWKARQMGSDGVQ